MTKTQPKLRKDIEEMLGDMSFIRGAEEAGLGFDATVKKLLSLINKERKKEGREVLEITFETLKLWRPIFYRDKVTEEDLKELGKLKKELEERKD